MKPLINVQEISSKMKSVFADTEINFKEPLIMEPFFEDFRYSFCWSSNAIEGNTLTLDDTISFLDYDEVRSGHTFSEYEEARRLNKAITTFLDFKGKDIDEKWIQEIDAVIIDSEAGYRKKNVYIGTMAEAVYYPPAFERIPELMGEFSRDINFRASDIDEVIRKSVSKHIEFERIHPFEDGNGRTGRIILNQCLINNGLLPVSIEPKSKYCQAFRQYDKNEDISLMEHIIYKAELASLEKVRCLSEKLSHSMQEKNKKHKSL